MNDCCCHYPGKSIETAQLHGCTIYLQLIGEHRALPEREQYEREEYEKYPVMD